MHPSMQGEENLIGFCFLAVLFLRQCRNAGKPEQLHALLDSGENHLFAGFDSGGHIRIFQKRPGGDVILCRVFCKE